MKLRLLILSSLLLLIMPTVACSPQDVSTEPEPQIPSHFTTYTSSEGLFSISYPLDWMGVETGDISEDSSVLFIGGIPTEDFYYPILTIMRYTRATDSRTLDEIVEGYLIGMQSQPGYHEYARVKAVVDGRNAVIIDMEAELSTGNVLRSLELRTIEGEFMWTVECLVRAEDFNDYEDTFYSIVRSLRILNYNYIGRIDVSKPSAVRGNWSGRPIEFILPVDYKLELALQVDAGDVVFTVADYWGYHKHDDVVSEGEWSFFSVTAKQNGEVYRCYFDSLPDATDYQKSSRKAYLHFNQTPEGWERVK